MMTLKIAFRNVFRQKLRSIFTGLVIAIGYIVLSFSLSLVEGTYGTVIREFTRAFTGHLQVHKEGYLEKPSLYKTLSDYDTIEKKILSAGGVKSTAPRLYSGALSFVGKKTTVAKIVGIDPEKEAEATTIVSRVEKGTYLDKNAGMQVMIGGGLADFFGIGVGDELVLVGQGADGSLANDIFKISAIMKGGKNSRDRNNCYMHISTAREYLSMGDRFHEVTVMLDDYHLATAKVAGISAALEGSGAAVSPWQKIEKIFYKSMEADKQGNWISFIIIVTIVSIIVLTTVLMTILERTVEYGIIKALGTRPSSILYMILVETAWLATIAIGVGFVGAFALNYWFTLYGIDYPVPMDVGGFTFTTMYGEMNIGAFLIPAVVSFAASVLVSIIPGIRAMRIIPVNAMRAH